MWIEKSLWKGKFMKKKANASPLASYFHLPWKICFFKFALIFRVKSILHPWTIDKVTLNYRQSPIFNLELLNQTSDKLPLWSHSKEVFLWCGTDMEASTKLPDVLFRSFHANGFSPSGIKTLTSGVPVLDYCILHWLPCHSLVSLSSFGELEAPILQFTD